MKRRNAMKVSITLFLFCQADAMRHNQDRSAFQQSQKNKLQLRTKCCNDRLSKGGWCLSGRGALTVLAGLTLLSQVNPRTYTVMPIGDSLTLGTSSGQESPPIQGGYRAPLLAALQQAGQSVQFIGTSQENGTPLQLQQNQANHSGYFGYRADELSYCLDGPDPLKTSPGFWFTRWQPKLDPDIIFLMAGTNDILQNFGPQGAANNTERLIARIRALRSNASLVVAQIPPLFGPLASQVPEYNAYLQAVVAKYQQSGAQIQVADQYTPLVPFGAQFHDQIHPDGITYRAVALNWFSPVLLAIWSKMAAEQAAVPSAINVCSNLENINNSYQLNVSNSTNLLAAGNDTSYLNVSNSTHVLPVNNQTDVLRVSSGKNHGAVLPTTLLLLLFRSLVSL